MLKGLLGNQYVWFALIVGALWGAYKWEGHKVKAARAELAAALEAKGKVVSDLMKAETYNKGLKDSLEMANEEALRQADIAAERARKERLAWIRLEQLKKDVANATDNAPVPDAVELLLDSLRSPVPGPGDADADGSEDDGETDLDRDALPGPAGAPAETPVG